MCVCVFSNFNLGNIKYIWYSFFKVDIVDKLFIWVIVIFNFRGVEDIDLDVFCCDDIFSCEFFYLEFIIIMFLYWSYF